MAEEKDAKEAKIDPKFQKRTDAVRKIGTGKS
jgi:hypothetical protein